MPLNFSSALPRRLDTYCAPSVTIFETYEKFRQKSNLFSGKFQVRIDCAPSICYKQLTFRMKRIE